jgi:hypothetical protein
VTAEFPDGTTIPLYLFEKESATSGIYYNEDFTLPFAAGDYIITVEDLDGHTYAHTDTLDVDPIGYPDAAAITATVSGTQVDLSWDPVTDAGFYRVELYDINQNRIHNFVTAETTYTIPEGYLKENTFYRYRITAWREFFDQGVDNASSSGMGHLKNSFVTTPAPGEAPPEINLDEKGAYVVHFKDPDTGVSRYLLEFVVSVSDLDGVPENIAHVRVTYPDETTRELLLDGRLTPGATRASYTFYEPLDTLQDILEGTYTFEVMDHDGSTASITDILNVDPIPVPAGSQPSDGTVIRTTTPLISWQPVPGAGHYKVIFFQDWNTQIHETAELAANYYQVPEGILTTTGRYSYRIHAYKQGEQSNLDNMSINQLYVGQRPHFSIDDPGGPPVPGDFDNNDRVDLADMIPVLRALTDKPPEQSIHLPSDVDGDDKAGIIDTIYILQKTLQGPKE